MGIYISPAKLVQERGRKVDMPKSWESAQKLLSDGQGLVAVAERPHGLVALLIRHRYDFNSVVASETGSDLYIVEQDLVRLAS